MSKDARLFDTLTDDELFEYLDEPICPICGANHNSIARNGFNENREQVYYCRSCGVEFTYEW